MSRRHTDGRKNENDSTSSNMRPLKWIAGWVGLLVVLILLLVATEKLLLPNDADGRAPIGVGIQDESSTPTTEPTQAPLLPPTVDPGEIVVETQTPVPTAEPIATTIPTEEPVPTEELIPTIEPTPPEAATSTPAPTEEPSPSPTPTSEEFPTPTAEIGGTASPESSTSNDSGFTMASIFDIPLALSLNPPGSIYTGSSMTAQVLFPLFTFPTGTVSYSVRHGTDCGETVFADGGTKTVSIFGVGASNSVTFPAAGSYSWLATYSGDGTYFPSTVCKSFVVNNYSPSVGLTITAAVFPMKAGGTATGRATLTGASTTAGGSLTYQVFSDNTCTTELTATNNPNSVIVTNRAVPSSAAITLNQVGTMYWRATYAGDGANNSAMSGCIAQVVNKSTPTLTLSLAPKPITVIGTSSGVATLSKISNLAGGSMVYTVYADSSCTTQVNPASTSTTTVSGGVAPNSAPFTFSSPGTVYVRAVYSGDASSFGVTSSCVSLAISKTTPTVGLSINPGVVPFVAGGTAIGSVTLINASTTAGGSLVYTAYSNATCTTMFATPGNPSTVTVANMVAPNSSGLAFPTNTTYYWKAVYGGDANNTSASSPCTALTYDKATPTVDTAPVGSPVRAGIGVQSAATLTGATTAAIGTVVYTIYTDSGCSLKYTIGNNPSTVTVTNQSAPLSAPITFQAAGDYWERAVYSGDSNNLGASSSCVAFTVEKSDPTLTLSVTPKVTPMKAGGLASGVGTLTNSTTAASGSMLYTVYTDSACSVPYSTTGNPSTRAVTNHFSSASALITLDLATSFYWNAVYSGDSNNNPSTSACIEIAVAKADPSIALVISQTITPMRAEGTAYGRATLALSSDGASGAVDYTVFSDSGCTSPYEATGSPSSVIAANKIIPNSASIPFPNAGTFYWEAVYAGDANNNGATSACVSFVVAKTSPFPWLAVYPTTYPLKVGGSLYGILYLNGVTTSVTGTATFTVYSDFTCATSLTASGSPSTVEVVPQVNTQSAPITIPFAGTIYMRVTYGGDSNNNTATSRCVAVIIGKATPAVILIPTATTAPMTIGGTAYGKATLVGSTANAGGELSYTAYTDSGCSTTLSTADNPNSVTVVNKIAPNSASITVSIVGTIYWKANYGGDTNNVGATSGCVAFSVAKASPSLSLTVTPSTSPMVVGSNASGSSTLSGATTTAGGSVTYTVYSNNVCSTQTVPANISTKTVTNGTVSASDSFTFLSTGTVYWKAAYSGDAANGIASSGCTPLSIVDVGATTVSLAMSPNPAMIESSVVGQATLSGTTGSAGGMVTYTVFTDESCSTQISPNQTSTKTVVDTIVPQSAAFSYDTVGTVFWIASYSGDATNASAVSPCSALTLDKANTSIQLSITPNPVEAGNAVTGTASITGATSTAGGTVTYGVFTNNVCSAQISPAPVSPVTVSNGIVPDSTPMSTLQIGTAFWQAHYTGDPNNHPSTSSCVALNVNKASTSITTSTSPEEPKVGESILLNATLNGATSTAEGSVTYIVYSDQTCETKVIPSQQSTKTVEGGVTPSSDTVTFLQVGTVYWQAVYSGDANNLAATSTCVSMTLSKATPTLTIEQDPNPINIGDELTVHATLSSDAVSPTGTVTFGGYQDSDCLTLSPGIELYVTVLVNGVVPDLPPTVFDFATTIYGKATYSGDANNAPATSLCSAAVVAKGLSLTVTLEPASTILHGETSSAHASWLPADTPVGAITYTAFTGADCTGTALAAPEIVTISGNAATASTPIAFPDPGVFSWQASFPGDSIFNPATACSSLIVQATPTLSAQQDPSPINIGQEYTIHFALSSDAINPTGSVIADAYLDSDCLTPAPGIEPYVVDLVNGEIADMPPEIFEFATIIYGQASYSGDANNAPAISPCTGAVVAKGLSLTVAIVPAATILHGESSAAHAIWPSNETPTGSITYAAFSGSDCTGTPLNDPETVAIASNEVASSTELTFNDPGHFSWQAIYPGDGPFNPVTVCTPFTVQATPTLTLEQDPNPVNIGDEFTVHASLSADAVSPTGTVTFGGYQDSNCLTVFPGTELFVTTIVNGEIPDVPPTIFDFPMTIYGQATYSGDANNAPATTLCSSAIIAKGLSLSVTLEPASTILHGETSAAHASWLPTDTPVGAITYTAFTGADCTGTALAAPEIVTISGNAVTASTPIAFPDPGVFSWQASFPGDSIFNPATACTSLIVQATPTLSIIQLPNPVKIGEAFTAHMELSPDAISPTGSVTLAPFIDDACQTQLVGLDPYVVELVDGLIADPALSIFNFSGVFYGQAVYSGDANNSAATTPCSPITVEFNPLTVNITGGTFAPINYSQAETINNGQLVMTVTDERATGEGWSISVGVSALAYDGSSPSGTAIPNENLSISSVTDPRFLWGQPIGTGGPSADPGSLGSLDQYRSVATASPGYGTGSYEFTLNIAINIPAASQAGTYIGTIVILIAAAP